MTSPAPEPSRLAPFVVAPQPPRLAETLGPIAAWVCLTTYLLSSFVLHVVVRQPLVPLGVTNVLGAFACIVALLLMRRGHYVFGTRMLGMTVVADTVLDMFLGASPFDPAMVFAPNVVVGACLLLGTRDAVVAAVVYLIAIPASVPWRAVADGAFAPRELTGVIMTELACIGATMLVVVARHAMMTLVHQSQTLAGRLSELVERAPDGIILMEEDGTVRHANGAAERCLAPHVLRPGVSLPSLLLRHDGAPADAPYLRSAGLQLLRAYVRDVERDLAITGARLELPGHARFVELIVRDVSPRGREGRPAVAGASALAKVNRGALRRILVVDDDAAVRGLIARQLARMEWDVTSCAGGLDALRHLATNPTEFDVLLTDVRMPALDGPELARRVRALVPSLPIVLMSGETAGLTRDLVLPGRPWLFLEKPFGGDRLQEVLERAMTPPRPVDG